MHRTSIVYMIAQTVRGCDVESSNSVYGTLLVQTKPGAFDCHPVSATSWGQHPGMLLGEVPLSFTNNFGVIIIASLGIVT